MRTCIPLVYIKRLIVFKPVQKNFERVPNHAPEIFSRRYIVTRQRDSRPGQPLLEGGIFRLVGMEDNVFIDLILIFPPSFENRIGFRDFSRLLVNGHLDEKDIVDTDLIAQDLSHPIHNGFPAHSLRGFSPFCQYPNQMGSVLLIAPVKFISGHIFSSIHSRVNRVKHSQGKRLSH